MLGGHEHARLRELGLASVALDIATRSQCFIFARRMPVAAS
jgi:hypothetical protein